MSDPSLLLQALTFHANPRPYNIITFIVSRRDALHGSLIPHILSSTRYQDLKSPFFSKEFHKKKMDVDVAKQANKKVQGVGWCEENGNSINYACRSDAEISAVFQDLMFLLFLHSSTLQFTSCLDLSGIIGTTQYVSTMSVWHSKPMSVHQFFKLLNDDYQLPDFLSQDVPPRVKDFQPPPRSFLLSYLPKQLKTLRLDRSIPEEGVIKGICQTCTSLEQLDFSAKTCSDAVIQEFTPAFLAQLRVLNLSSDTDFSTQKPYTRTCTDQAVDEKEDDDCPFGSTHKIMTSSMWSLLDVDLVVDLLSKCKNLEALSWASFASHLKQERVDTIFSNLPRLRQFCQLGPAEDVSILQNSQSFKHLLSTQLERLTLDPSTTEFVLWGRPSDKVPSISPEFLEAAVYLRYLDLSHFSSELKFAPVVENIICVHLQGLEVLRLTECDALYLDYSESERVNFDCFKQLKNLRVLEMGIHLTSATQKVKLLHSADFDALFHPQTGLCSHSSKLEFLDIRGIFLQKSGCEKEHHHLEDNIMMSGIRHHHSLKTLKVDVNDDFSMSETSQWNFLVGMNRLENLEVRGAMHQYNELAGTTGNKDGEEEMIKLKKKQEMKKNLFSFLYSDQVSSGNIRKFTIGQHWVTVRYRRACFDRRTIQDLALD